MKILAVDDDELFLSMLVAAVAMAGFTDVTTANSAAEAEGYIAKASTPFDCVLLDIQMPGKDGIALCGWIREQKAYELAPILMVSSVSDRGSVERALAAGATDYITKPLEMLELTTRLSIADRMYATSRELNNSRLNTKVLRAQMNSWPALNSVFF